jgi:hypothetical protein
MRGQVQEIDIEKKKKKKKKEKRKRNYRKLIKWLMGLGNMK